MSAIRFLFELCRSCNMFLMCTCCFVCWVVCCLFHVCLPFVGCCDSAGLSHATDELIIMTNVCVGRSFLQAG